MLLQPDIAVSHRIGEIVTKDAQAGVSIAVHADAVTLTVLQAGAVYYCVAIDAEQAVEVAGFFKKGADILLRQGGSGLGDSKHFDPMNFGGIIFPGATLGGHIALGHVFPGGDWRQALSTKIRGNMLVLRALKDGAKHYEIEFGIQQVGKLAEFFTRAASLVTTAGGSASLA